MSDLVMWSCKAVMWLEGRRVKSPERLKEGSNTLNRLTSKPYWAVDTSSSQGAAGWRLMTVVVLVVLVGSHMSDLVLGMRPDTLASVIWPVEGCDGIKNAKNVKALLFAVKHTPGMFSSFVRNFLFSWCFIWLSLKGKIWPSCLN